MKQSLALALVAIFVALVAIPAPAQAQAAGNAFCPVCGKTADPNVSLRFGGKTMFFASEACKAEFKEKPLSFLKKMRAEARKAPVSNCATCPSAGKCTKASCATKKPAKKGKRHFKKHRKGKGCVACKKITGACKGKCRAVCKKICGRKCTGKCKEAREAIKKDCKADCAKCPHCAKAKAEGRKCDGKGKAKWNKCKCAKGKCTCAKGKCTCAKGKCTCAKGKCTCAKGMKARCSKCKGKCTCTKARGFDFEKHWKEHWGQPCKTHKKLHCQACFEAHCKSTCKGEIRAICEKPCKRHRRAWCKRCCEKPLKALMMKEARGKCPASKCATCPSKGKCATKKACCGTCK